MGETNWTEQEYLQEVRRLRRWIESGCQENVQRAKEGLDKLKDIRPWRLEYICARVALMLAMGEDKKLCRNVLDHVDQEYEIHPELQDLFTLKQRTYAVGSLEARQAGFSVDLYQKKNLDSLYWKPLEKQKGQFLKSCGEEKVDAALLKQLAESYYVVRNMTMYFVLMMAWCKSHGCLSEWENALADFDEIYVSNIGYLVKMFQDEKNYTFLLLDAPGEKLADVDVLAKALHLLGQEVIILREDRYIHSLEVPAKTELLHQSMEQAELVQGNVVIHPFVWETPDGVIEDTRAELVQFIADTFEQETALIVFANDQLMNDFHQRKSIARNFQRMSNCLPVQFSYAMSFAWAGDYLKYISYIYGFSAQECLEQPAQCEFSIVLPVRNNADTLRYTLQTCLAQRFQGSYEIVLSDNSDEDHHDVYDLYCELKDSHIRYYHTPQPLELAKSFEFAFLKARGEFIFSLGADDGVFPWTLEVLHELLPQMGKHDILQWQRGFYAWPGFNYGQQNQLNIPIPSKKDSIHLTQCEARKFAGYAIAHPQEVFYGLPLFYINSGFRRDYLRRLLQATGRLWDGPCQDIYMGVVNLAINDTTLLIEYPLTMAGMSSHSLGASTLSVVDELTTFARGFSTGKVPLCQQMGNYVRRQSEYIFPWVPDTDWLAFYCPVWRLFECGCFSESEVAHVDGAMIYTHLTGKINRRDILFEKKWGAFFYSQRFSNMQQYWASSQEAYHKLCQPVKMGAVEPSMQQLYKVGIDLEKKEVCVDGSKFHIGNIQDAVDFGTNLLGR